MNLFKRFFSPTKATDAFESLRKDVEELEKQKNRDRNETRRIREITKLLNKPYQSLVDARKVMGLNNTAFDSLVAKGIIKQSFDDQGVICYKTMDLVMLKTGVKKGI
jgi:hypothetical protein